MRFRGLARIAALVVLATALSSSCKSSDGDGANDSPEQQQPNATGGAGGDGASDGGPHRDASLGTGGAAPNTILCGPRQCGVPPGANLELITACCLPGNECGLTFPGATSCLPKEMEGRLWPECEPLALVSSAPLGCCGPQGCGVMDAFLGCVPNTRIGSRKYVPCEYDRESSCSSLLDVTCDGPEDCASGKRCCARFTGAGYSEVGCHASCEALAVNERAPTTWVELCHAGDRCEDRAATCRTSVYLPPPLARCHTEGRAAEDTARVANSVNCGASVCGSGQKCCVRPPHDPYCTAAKLDCRCDAVGVPVDAGVDAEGGADAQADSGDASADASEDAPGQRD